MKSLAVKIFSAALVLTASCALAEVKDFGLYTVDVIDGWTAVPQGDTVYFVKNDNSASWSVMFGQVPDGANVEQYARDVMNQTKGSDFQTNDKGTYEFTFPNPNGQETHVMISELSGNNFMQWGISAAGASAGEELKKLIGSMAMKKSEPVKTFNSKYFTFAVPSGWDGYEIDETSVRVNKDDETASMYVEIADLDGWEIDDLAEFYANECKADDLEKDGASYTFSYREDGKINVASLGSDGKVYVLVINTANDKAGFEAISKLRGLIKRK
ncbi:MAG: hypothetical protein IJU48_06095 [Synergistaceae bacterium]|nr:hypothetical protein [Synergistaceae bacterium]